MRLIQELRRRNVLRVAAGYVALSWLAIQVAETVLPAFGLADYIRLVVIAAVIGFVPALAFAWVFELTPDGFKLDREVDRDAADVRRLDKRLDRVAIVILALAVAYFAFDKLVLDPARDAAFREAMLGGGGDDPAAVHLGDASLVTDFPGEHGQPTLSSDGRRMAFISADERGVAQLWVMSLPDGAPVQLTSGEIPAAAPSWSPNDEAILFQRGLGEEGQSVWLADALGARKPRLVVAGGKTPRFAADGRSFVFARGLKDIWLGYLDGTEPVQLAGLPATDGFAPPMPAINAAGDVVFVLAEEGPIGDLWLYAAATGDFRRLTQGSGRWPGAGAQWPVWLPDGRSVIYAAPDGEAASMHLWRIDTVTGETVRLTAGAGGYGHAAVSADGSRLVYAHSRPAWRLLATDPRSGDHRTIHQSRDPFALPVVSPDGDTVVFFAEDGVFTAPIAGGPAEQRTFGPPAEATLPTWDRGGTAIYYYKGRTLQRLDPATGLGERVMRDFHWSRQNWLAVHGDRLAYNLRGSRRTVVRDLGTGEESTLDRHVLTTDWSRDGQRLLGRGAAGSEIMVCSVPGFSCAPIMDDGVPVTGALPRWSADESRVFYRWARPDQPGYADIWSIPVAGGVPRLEATIGPYDPRAINFGISSTGEIVWNEFDPNGLSEIWLSDDLALP